MGSAFHACKKDLCLHCLLPLSFPFYCVKGFILYFSRLYFLFLLQNFMGFVVKLGTFLGSVVGIFPFYVCLRVLVHILDEFPVVNLGFFGVFIGTWLSFAILLHF